MTITYCLIANSHCPLAEYDSIKNPKSSEIAYQLISNLRFDKNETESINCDGKNYTYLVDSGLAFICVADSNFSQSSAITFLKHIQKLFINQFGERGKATKLKFDMNRDFAMLLKKQMDHFSSSAGLEKLELLKRDVNNVTNEMQKNIGKVLERGDKVNLLVEKTDSLNIQSEAFAKSSKKLRRHMWLQNIKMTIFIIIIGIGLLIGAYFFIKKRKTIKQPEKL